MSRGFRCLCLRTSNARRIRARCSARRGPQGIPPASTIRRSSTIQRRPSDGVFLCCSVRCLSNTYLHYLLPFEHNGGIGVDVLDGLGNDSWGNTDNRKVAERGVNVALEGAPRFGEMPGAAFPLFCARRSSSAAASLASTSSRFNCGHLAAPRAALRSASPCLSLSAHRSSRREFQEMPELGKSTFKPCGLTANCKLTGSHNVG